MGRKVALNIDEKLYAKIEKNARKNGESVQDFLARAVCDALDMWDDFYDLDQLEEKDRRPQMSFCIHS